MSYKKFEEMPQGWRFDKSWGSPYAGYTPICDGKSVLNGGEKGLLKIKKINIEPNIYSSSKKIIHNADIKHTTEQEKTLIPKAMNDLSRLRMKELILRDLTTDLIVCKIEGWGMQEYITDLKNLINDVANSILR